MNIDNWESVFQNKKIVVLGDVMLDSYLIGHVSRISPEAPVPIVSLEKEEFRLGGAANVALNLIHLGCETHLCSIIGSDADGKKLQQLCTEKNIQTDGLFLSTNRKTTKKTRVLGNHQQLIRIDSEQVDQIIPQEELFILEHLETIFKKGIDALIFEDYDKGCLNPDLIKKVINLAKKYHIIITVDPKKEHFFAYQGVDLFKPNLKELKEGLNISFSITDKTSLQNAVYQLKEKLHHDITMITLSEHGVLIHQNDKTIQIPAHIRSIADVSGAGDTVISVATICLIAQLPIEIIAEVANLAGGLVCEKSGVVSIELEELIAELKDKKISFPSHLKQI